MARIQVWDLPVRMFHWALVICIVGAFATMWGSELFSDPTALHKYFGLTLLGLVVFRIVWGFFGNTNARFCNFVRGPAAIKAYLQGKWQGNGHNPLGALSVLTLLLIVLAQACTGLFTDDDINFTGPLYTLITTDLSKTITGLHHLIADFIVVLVILHLAAIKYYAIAKKEKMVKPMITGWKEGVGESAKPGSKIGLLIAIIAALVVVYAASGAFLPPPPVITTPTPGW